MKKFRFMELSIVIPTYNEKENIEQLIKKVFHIFNQNRIKGEIVIVDDNSSDCTGEIAEKLKKKYKSLKVLHRKGKLGLSSAVFDGFKISAGNVLGVMDADLSHPPEKIPEMFFSIKNNEADFVIGSRYVKGGGIKGWNFKRKTMSRTATLLARLFTKVKDPMSGFFLIKKECLKRKEFDSKGFKILLELIVKSDYKKIKEIPIVFVDRVKGKSKAGLGEIFYYLKNLAGYLKYKNFIREFFKFSLVGFTGAIINIFILYSLTEFLGIYYIVSAFFAFIFAATNNFILNKIWTFKEIFREKVFSKYIKFFCVSLGALAINLLFLYFFTEFFGIYYIISQILAIGIALIINFIGNKSWTFGK